VAGIAVFREGFLPKLVLQWPRFCAVFSRGIIVALPWIALAASFLMVSRIRYAHLMNAVMQSRKPPLFFALIFLALLLAFYHIEIALLLGFVGYALTGVLCGLREGLNKKARGMSGEE
jgi:phosphatidylserine synthase